jgi:hypothetical protein
MKTCVSLSAFESSNAANGDGEEDATDRAGASAKGGNSRHRPWDIASIAAEASPAFTTGARRCIGHLARRADAARRSLVTPSYRRVPTSLVCAAARIIRGFIVSTDIAFGFLTGVVLGVLAGAELTAGLSRLAGKRSPHGETATPTGMLLATFRRLFSILLP